MLKAVEKFNDKLSFQGRSVGMGAVLILGLAILVKWDQETT